MVSIMLTIRPSTLADGPRILDVWRSSVDATHNFLSASDRRDIEREVAAFLPHAPLFVAVDRDDRAMGFMLLENCHLQALFVHAAHRGSGVGRALVEHALCLCPGLSADVNEQNGQAIGFYERMGFKRVGRSETDDQGRPYPLLRLRRAGAE